MAIFAWNNTVWKIFSQIFFKMYYWTKMAKKEIPKLDWGDWYNSMEGFSALPASYTFSRTQCHGCHYISWHRMTEFPHNRDLRTHM